MSQNPFNPETLYHPEGHSVPARLVSIETKPVEEKNINGTPRIVQKPIVEITPDGSTLQLSFIRSTKEFPFADLMKQFLCYAAEQGYTKVKLEDDAMFTNDADVTCVYRALIYRLFQGKDSLYVGKGFRPAVNVTEEKKRLVSATVGQVKEIVNLLSPKFSENLTNVRAELMAAPDERNFGEWILEQPCHTIREFINKIDSATGKLKATTNIGAHGRQYLEDWKKYKQAHNILEREPVCSEGGGRLRSRTRSSSGRKHKRRVTRKDRRYRKGTKKA